MLRLHARAAGFRNSVWVPLLRLALQAGLKKHGYTWQASRLGQNVKKRPASRAAGCRLQRQATKWSRHGMAGNMLDRWEREVRWASELVLREGGRLRSCNDHGRGGATWHACWLTGKLGRAASVWPQKGRRCLFPFRMGEGDVCLHQARHQAAKTTELCIRCIPHKRKPMELHACLGPGLGQEAKSAMRCCVGRLAGLRPGGLQPHAAGWQTGRGSAARCSAGQQWATGSQRWQPWRRWT